MIRNINLLYFIGFFLGLILSFCLSPLFRKIALRYGIIDHPNTSVKTHRHPTPYLGGCAIALSFFFTLTLIRFLSDYPTGTLLPIKGIFLGGFLIILLGLVDDIVSGGLTYKGKFVIQFAAGTVLIFFGIHLNFIHPRWVAFFMTVIWVTGVMNAINIIDIMDGLAGGITVIASLAFFFISLPTEHIYVNLTSIVLAGSCIGFLPFNLSKNKKMFMGDTGSLFIGFVLAALSLGTEYTKAHNATVLAPILILGVPLYDTFFVMLMRYRKGISPFLGSKDHFALRLEKMGYSRNAIIWMGIAASIALSVCAWLTTRIWFWWAVGLYACVFVISWIVGTWLAKVQVSIPSDFGQKGGQNSAR